MNLREAIQAASTSVARRDAETLALHLLGRERGWLLAHPEFELTTGVAETLNRLVARRAAHEPLQYITGHQEFYGLPLRVTPDVLIPRPETELLVEAVLGWLGSRAGTPPTVAPHLVDVGTGSGAIALALAAQLPRARIWALDTSPAALGVARENAERLGLLSPRLRFVLSDLLGAFSATSILAAESLRIDAIISNPPYVPASDASTLQPEVRDFEPHLALFAGEDGLDIYRRLIPQAWETLCPGGLLALEFGFGQKAALSTLLEGWGNVRFTEDLAGIPRIVLAERGESGDGGSP